MKKARPSDFAGYSLYDEPVTVGMVLVQLLPIACGISGLVAMSYGYMRLGLILWVAIPIILAITAFIPSPCPKCGGTFTSYSDEAAETEDGYGVIYVCHKCRHYFCETYRWD